MGKHRRERSSVGHALLNFHLRLDCFVVVRLGLALQRPWRRERGNLFHHPPFLHDGREGGHASEHDVLDDVLGLGSRFAINPRGQALESASSADDSDYDPPAWFRNGNRSGRVPWCRVRELPGPIP